MFVRWHGWSLENVRGMVASAGTRPSKESGDDSDAKSSDPIWRATRTPVGDLASLYDATIAAHFPFEYRRFAEYQCSARTHLAIRLLIRGLLAIARQTTHRDVVVIFGRDCYPAQAILDVIGHKLRGTWIYAEGVSREVAGDDTLRKSLAECVARHRGKGGRVFGVDTGWTGSVPEGALAVFARRHGYWNQIRSSVTIRLLSTGSRSRDAFGKSRDRNGRLDSAAIRNAAVALEHLPKPFMRATQVDKRGRPVMRLAGEVDIMKAAAIYDLARQIAETIDVPGFMRAHHTGPLPVRPLPAECDIQVDNLASLKW